MDVVRFLSRSRCTRTNNVVRRPIPIFIAVLFAPESPWFLLRAGRPEEARESLRRLGNQHPDQAMAAITHTDEVEKIMHAGGCNSCLGLVSFRVADLFFGPECQTYLDCFRGTNLRRTEIVCMVW